MGITLMDNPSPLQHHKEQYHDNHKLYNKAYAVDHEGVAFDEGFLFVEVGFDLGRGVEFEEHFAVVLVA